MEPYLKLIRRINKSSGIVCSTRADSYRLLRNDDDMKIQLPGSKYKLKILSKLNRLYRLYLFHQHRRNY